MLVNLMTSSLLDNSMSETSMSYQKSQQKKINRIVETFPVYTQVKKVDIDLVYKRVCKHISGRWPLLGGGNLSAADVIDIF